MNNKILVLLLIALCVILSKGNAQVPVLTASGVNPVPGDQVTGYNFVGTISPGSAGAAQTWDYSTLGSTAPDNIPYAAVSSTPYADSFPNANLAEYIAVNQYAYFLTSSSAWQRYGENYPPYVYANYTDPADILRYPFTYNDNYTDHFAGTGYLNSPSYYIKGTWTITADAYGTLKTPIGTYSNCLRIHTVSNEKDSIPGNLPDSTSYENYGWFANGYHGAIVNIARYNNTGSWYGSYFMLTYITGEQEHAPASVTFNLFPNPASDQLNIQASSLYASQKDALKMLITDVFGQLIFQSAITNPQSVIDISTFSQGLYFVRVKGESERWLGKFVKE